ncbi:hypothetical protein B5J92_03315 [Moraxella atlantae]|nr:hypothetical protein B5J92_03315 [Moraxella atlantae]
MCKHGFGVALYPPPKVGGFTATDDKNLFFKSSCIAHQVKNGPGRSNGLMVEHGVTLYKMIKYKMIKYKMIKYKMIKYKMIKYKMIKISVQAQFLIRASFIALHFAQT